MTYHEDRRKGFFENKTIEIVKVKIMSRNIFVNIFVHNYFFANFICVISKS